LVAAATGRPSSSKDHKPKSDLVSGLEGALIGAIGGAVVGGGAGVAYNEYEKHHQPQQNQYQY